MSLLDTLMPANPPTPRSAREVRPLDGDPIDLSAPPTEHYMNSKAASLRALLYDNPAGMDYDQLSKHTGIARDKIAAHVAGLLTSGDAKKYMEGERVFFKFSGDASRIGDRRPNQQPSAKPAEPKTAAPPAPTAASQKDAEPARAVEQKAAAPKATAPVAQPRAESDRAGSASAPAAAAAPVQQTAVAHVPAIAASAHTERREATAAPAEPKRGDPLDLMTELTIVAAANLAAEVRALDLNNGPAIARALQNFERADRLREEIKAGRAA